LRPPPPRATLFPYTTLFRSGKNPRVATRGLLTSKKSSSPHGRLLAVERQRSIPAVGFLSGRPARNSRPCRIPRRRPCPSSLPAADRKSTRLNSSHLGISYAV